MYTCRPTEAKAEIPAGQLTSSVFPVGEFARGSFTTPRHFNGSVISFQISGNSEDGFADLCGLNGKQVLIDVQPGHAYPLPKEVFSGLFARLMSNAHVSESCVFSVSLRG